MNFADRSMEAVCYYAYLGIDELAEERGRYATYKGSLWDRGVMPQDSLKLLREERGGYVEIDDSSSMDWESLRARIKDHGMRNSNCVAIAPTATISNIVGVAASIEPEYQNIYVKSNLSGEFTVVNEHLVAELKSQNLWDEVMVADLKYFDGSLARIDRVPAPLRQLYATAFEVDAKWIVEAGARRQKWIDQAQSLNIYMSGASGKKLDDVYKLAWVRGLKTTYYLRTLGGDLGRKIHGPGRRTERRVVLGRQHRRRCVGQDLGITRRRRGALGAGAGGAEILFDRQSRLRGVPVVAITRMIRVYMGRARRRSGS